MLTNVSFTNSVSKTEEQKLPKVKADFVSLKRVSLPIELIIKDWKAFERIYRPKGTPEEAKKLPKDNIAVSTEEEEALFQIPDTMCNCICTSTTP